jgi:putative membrane-bound dehydrogenase-like protein
VFTHSRVGKPGTPDEQRTPINAGIWRYHPTKHVFEVFAEGTSNPWGIDFNDRGQAFITACVIPHLYHVIQGARYQRQAGQHFNPHVYRDIQNIGDHVHWLGDQGPHAGNEKSGSAGGGHAHCGAMIYLGGLWPEQYRDTLFMANIHGNRLNNDKLVAKGSGYVGTHAPTRC